MLITKAEVESFHLVLSLQQLDHYSACWRRQMHLKVTQTSMLLLTHSFSFPKCAFLYIIFARADRNIRENAEGRGALWPVIKSNPEQQMCVHAKPPTFMNGLCCGQKRVFSLLSYPPQSAQKSHNRIGSANSVRHNPSNFIILIASQELHSLNPSYSNPI